VRPDPFRGELRPDDRFLRPEPRPDDRYLYPDTPRSDDRYRPPLAEPRPPPRDPDRAPYAPSHQRDYDDDRHYAPQYRDPPAELSPGPRRRSDDASDDRSPDGTPEHPSLKSPTPPLARIIPPPPDLVAPLSPLAPRFGPAALHVVHTGPRLLEVTADQFLLDAYLRKLLDESGVVTRFGRLSYGRLCAEFATPTMAEHAVSRLMRLKLTDKRIRHYHFGYVDNREDFQAAILRRQRDEGVVFETPKCLVVHNFPSDSKVENFVRAFDLIGDPGWTFSPAEKKLITFHRTLASVNDFYEAFQDGLSGVPDTRVCEELNVRVLKQEVYECFVARLIDLCCTDCSELLTSDLYRAALIRAKGEARALARANRISKSAGRLLTFFVPTLTSTVFTLSALKRQSGEVLHQKMKRATKQIKKELLKKDSVGYQKKVVKEMHEEKESLESIVQPPLERDSSRLTPYHKIAESDKRNYLRPYARARLRPLVVARGSGLTLMQSQFPKDSSQFRNQKAGRAAAAGIIGKRVYYEKSAIQGWGLFALEPISPESLICEYTGDLVRATIADMRERKYTRSGMQMYLFRIDNDLIVDATVRGGKARFLNHSCCPNLRSKVVNLGNSQIISFYAVRFIKPHEELTFNYKMEFEDDRRLWERCFCGAKQCMGWINASEDPDLAVLPMDDFDDDDES
jgi:hypothetical protein